MPSAGFRIVQDTFTPALREAAAKLPNQVRAALEELIHQGEEHAKQIVPVDTGYLRSTIYGQVTGPLEAELRADADYAVFVEEGTSRMGARPYLRPSLEQVRQAMPGGNLAALIDAIMKR